MQTAKPARTKFWSPFLSFLKIQALYQAGFVGSAHGLISESDMSSFYQHLLVLLIRGVRLLLNDSGIFPDRNDLLFPQNSESSYYNLNSNTVYLHHQNCA